MGNLARGIQFEEIEIEIPWNTTIDKLKYFGTPDIIKNGNETEVIWRNVSLLNGIKGDWITSYYSFEKSKLFRNVSIYYSGDHDSLEAYNKIEKHLLTEFGTPILQNESDNEKEIKWEISNYYIYLHFFEMHAYRCILTVGLK